MTPREKFVRWLFDDVWSRGRTGDLGELLGPLTFHHGGASRRTDGAELAALIGRWREGFPDLEFSVMDLVEQGDLVAVRARLRGTHTGRWRDRPASGRRMDVDVAMFFRWEDDRIVEVWEVDDAARREAQLEGSSS